MKNLLQFTKFIIQSVFSLFVLSCQAQEFYEPLFPCNKKLNEQYGICNHISRKGSRYEFQSRHQDLALTDSVGASFIRTDCDWESLKTSNPLVLNYHDYDSVTFNVKQHNKSLLGILTLDSRKDITDEWINFVHQTCKRYRKSIGYWEIINEINLMYNWVKGYDMNCYLPFLREGYKAVKRVNPNAKVLFSGVSDVPEKTLDSIFSHGMGDCFDIMNVHLYTYKEWEPEDFIHNYRKLNRIMRKYYLDDKHLWLTETGVQNNLGKEGERVKDVRLPRIFLVSFALGVDKVFWYKSRSCELRPENKEDHFGLWHKDYSPTPSYYAYKTLIQMCPDRSTRPKLIRYGDVYIASWERPDRKKVWALWTSKKDNTVALNIGGEYKAYGNHGKEISLSLDKVDVTPSVIYIVGAKSVRIQE